MVRVAAVQIGPTEGDPDGTVAKAEHWLDKAGAEGTKLAVLPEGYLPGYGEIQEAKPSGSENAVAAVLGSLDPIPGPATERIAANAREHEMLVAFGILPPRRERGQAHQRIGAIRPEWLDRQRAPEGPPDARVRGAGLRSRQRVQRDRYVDRNAREHGLRRLHASRDLADPCDQR